jgi:hypothetical protein
MSIADEIWVGQTNGICSEEAFPYFGRPGDPVTPGAFTDAAGHIFTNPVRLDQYDWTAMKTALAGNQPVSFGMTVNQSFEETGADGIVPPVSGPELGGHAMLLVGYDDANGAWLVRNSWSANWGLAGYLWLPYNQTALIFEAWTAQLLPPPQPTPTPTP